MKASICVLSAAGLLPDLFLSIARLTGVVALAILCCAGCATKQPITLVQSGAPNTAAPIRLELGPIGLLSPSTPAEFRFDKAEGRLESPADAAGHAAGLMLVTPSSSDPAAEMAAGAVRFALAPLAAAAGALGPGHKALPPNKLSECESDLTRAMTLAADQQHFQQCLLKAAAETIPGRFELIDSAERPSADAPSVSAILEAGVEELHLERTGSDDASFALRIKARVRLLHAANRAVLYEQPFEFRSGTDLFIDWTRHNALQSVADTGYRELADHILTLLFSTDHEGPLLVGAGYKKHQVPSSDSQILVAAHHYEAGPRPRIEFVNHVDLKPASLADHSTQATAVRQFVSDGVARSDALGIYSTASVEHVTIQRPLTKEQAISEAVDDVEWSLDGLDNSHNSVIMLLATAAAVPMSLWKQTVGAVRGLTSKEYRAADESLTSAARQTRPQEQLAFQVAGQLIPRIAQPVFLAKGPFTPGEADQSRPSSSVAASSRSGRPGIQTVANRLVSQGGQAALEIHVLSAALTGEGGVNPPLALCVEAQADLLRASDGQRIYSVPIHYQGQRRKFTDWASDDARPFRQELDQCYHQMGSAIVNELVSRNLLPPGGTPSPVFAHASNP